MQTVSITDLYDDVKIQHLATKQDVAESKADMIKWVVGTFIALVIMILGLYATIIFKH